MVLLYEDDKEMSELIIINWPQISGRLRIVMKPLVRQIPLVGGLQVFFLNNPDVDFNLIGLADVFDMPGLR